MSYRILLSYLLNLFFGLLYPTAKSIEAVETGHDDAQWLTYWIIYTMLLISETLLWPVLKWVPLYGEAKAVLLAWLVLPSFKGATWVYEAIVGPGIMRLRDELRRVPAFERLLAQQDVRHTGQVHGNTPVDSAQFAEARKAQLSMAVQEVRESLTGELERIQGIQDPKAKQRAQRTFDKELAKIGNVTTAQKKAHLG